MARFGVFFGAVIAVIFFDGILLPGAAAGKKTSSKKGKPPSEQFDAWQCMPTWVPYGQTNCVIINKCQETGAGSKSTGCGWKMPVFCNESINAAVINKQAALPAGVAAPAGYKAYKGAGAYKIFTELKTWDDAKTACEAEGGGISLAVPSTAVEYAAVKDMLNTILPKEQAGIWLGISDPDAEGDYKTVFGQPLCTLPLVLWMPGNPNNYANEDCIGTGYAHYDNIGDYNCGDKMAYMCELPLPERLAACRT